MDNITFLKRGFFERVSGKPATHEPKDSSCWGYLDGKICIDLNKADELKIRGGAVRLEGKSLPLRVLVIQSKSGEYKAYQNKCTHMGRRLDLVPGTDTVQCCSLNKATFDLYGNKLYGPVSKSIKCYTVIKEDDNLIISI